MPPREGAFVAAFVGIKRERFRLLAAEFTSQQFAWQ